MGVITEAPQRMIQSRPKAKDVPCLFLDCDGTVRKGYDELGKFVNKPEDVEIFSEVPALLKRYKQLGYRIFFISNQGGIEMRMVSRDEVAANLNRTRDLLSTDGDPVIDQIYYCPHYLRQGRYHCFCRKPQIGMLVGASSFLRKIHNEFVSFDHSIVVGDRDEDRQLAVNANLAFMEAKEWRAIDPLNLSL